METSVLIAKILAIVYLSVGVGFALNGKYYYEAIRKLLYDHAYLFLGGWVATAIGVVMVHYHNIWMNEWRVLITIVAWAALIKGILLLTFPTFITAFEPWFTRKGISKLYDANGIHTWLHIPLLWILCRVTVISRYGFFWMNVLTKG